MKTAKTVTLKTSCGGSIAFRAIPALSLQDIGEAFQEAPRGLFPRKFPYALFMHWFRGFKEGAGDRFRLPSSRAAYRHVRKVYRAAALTIQEVMEDFWSGTKELTGFPATFSYALFKHWFSAYWRITRRWYRVPSSRAVYNCIRSARHVSLALAA